MTLPTQQNLSEQYAALVTRLWRLMNLSTKLFLYFLGVSATSLLLMGIAAVSLSTYQIRHDEQIYIDEDTSDPIQQVVTEDYVEFDLEGIIFIPLLVAGVISFGIALGASWFMSRRLVSPIREMAIASQEIANGQYNKRLISNRNDELGDLIDQFNHMVAALEQTEATRLQLLGDVSHEILTPLTSIKGYVEGLEDGVMAVLRFDNGMLVQLHDAFTVKHAGTGIEIHGESGSLVGRNVMSQQPVGEVLLRNSMGEQALSIEHENLYINGVAAFCAAMAGQGEPACTAEDGVRSLATALAVSEACHSGSSVKIDNPFV